MSAHVKPIKVYGEGGPNPPKVAIILGELGIPSEIVPVTFSDVKKPEYVAINPNGRLPSIHDPNTGITLWESGAIIEYLIERYDKDCKLTFNPGTPEYYHAKQWLYFQVSGQGPYYGQAAWFKKYHPEHIPSALDRYVKELHRVTNVLEGWLVRQEEEYGSKHDFDGPWLVGNKLSYADIAFISWQKLITMVLDKEEYNEENYPAVKKWLGKMTSRETVRSVLEHSERAAKKSQAETIALYQAPAN